MPFDEVEIGKNIKLRDILNTPDDSDIGFFIEVDPKYPDEIKEKTINFPFCSYISPKNRFCNYMSDIKPDNHIQHKKLTCDWTDRKKYLIHYRMLKFFRRLGIKVEKVHENISFKQSKWLEKCISFITQKRNRSRNDFEKDF